MLTFTARSRASPTTSRYISGTILCKAFRGIFTESNCVCSALWYTVQRLLGICFDHHSMTLKQKHKSNSEGIFEVMHLYECKWVGVYANLSSSGTCCHQAVLPPFFLQTVGYGGHQPTACGTKWMPEGERAPPRVKFVHRRCANLRNHTI